MIKIHHIARVIPAADSVYDYYFSFPQGQWTPWVESDVIKNYILSYEVGNSIIFCLTLMQDSIENILIPTAENQARLYVTDLLLQSNKPAILFGSSVGKTVELEQLIYDASEKTYTPLQIGLTKSISALSVQQILEANIERFKVNDSF